MTKIIYFLLLGTLFSCGQPHLNGNDRILNTSGVVYGENAAADNRAEANLNHIMSNNDISLEKAQMLLRASKAVAGLVDLGVNLKENSDGTFSPSTMLKTLDKQRRLCEIERFKNQYILPRCTGFLVGPDLLATAGHCVNNDNYTKKRWIFGLDSKVLSVQNPVFARSQVYKIKEILNWAKEPWKKRDFALVRLDRPVLGIRPLKTRIQDHVALNTPLAIIGHPSGLPLKIAANASVLDNTHRNAFKANLDSFGGNSGSPVFNLETGEVEGILISGALDYKVDGQKNCLKVNIMKNDEGKEFVAKISLLELDKFLEEGLGPETYNL